MSTDKELAILLNEQFQYIRLFDIKIPDLYKNPYIVQPITLANQQYYLEYCWNNRDEKCYFSMYKIINSKKIYYVTSIKLIPNINISKNIKKTDWNGLLKFINIDGGTDVSYTIKDISTKFKLLYEYVE